MTEIRPITDADIDAVARLHVRAWRSAYAGIVPADVLDALDPARFAQARRTRSAPPGTQTLVAEDAGTVTGFASIGPYRSEQKSDQWDTGVGELYALYVDPARWGAGIGRALLSAAQATLAATAVTEMRLWVLEENHRARRFYERAGLRPDGRRHYYTPRGSNAELPELRYAGPL
jgi:ribosomal protein S18 acetylase RimI-like enzyme